MRLAVEALIELGALLLLIALADHIKTFARPARAVIDRTLSDSRGTPWPPVGCAFASGMPKAAKIRS